MSKRLADMMNRVVLIEGERGKARLSLAAGRSAQMIDRYRNRVSKPPTDIARVLAIACGASEEEAYELALECSSEAQRTA